MNVPATDRFTVDNAVEIYGIDHWGNGYLAIRDNGDLVVSPTRDSSRAIDVLEVVESLRARDVRTPVLLRFPQLLESQVNELCRAFQNSIDEFRYAGRYQPVFPIKVNHHRGVVNGLAAAGWKHGLGLEAGSRPELMAAASLPVAEGSLLICNGYKDSDYLATAAMATRMGREVVVVLEKPFELEQYLELAKTETSLPLVGMRIKLQARGSGLWEKSGGVASKFGLTTLQVMRAIEQLSSAGLIDRFALLHFHIGSQITEIRKVKVAVREAARIYAKVRKLGVNIRYLDVGGGLGVDYDGSRTSSDASVNYSVQEYANDVVFGIHETCEEEHVPAPTIVSESGRMLSAYHSLLVTDVRSVISGIEPPPPLNGDEPQVILDMAEAARGISVKNYREAYHDALEYRDQMNSMFNLGLIELSDRAKGEALFWEIAGKAVRFSKNSKYVSDEFVELESKLHDKYICNFSVFQSLPDHWALDQLFPVMPIHRLNENPVVRATLVDITCDSDGEVDKFVDLKDIKDVLEVHPLRSGERYYLGFLLIGAYQDTMGDVHNLFGRVHEAEVLLDPAGKAVVRNVRRGERARDTLSHFGYHEERLLSGVQANLRERLQRGEIDPGLADELLDEYRRRLDQYTYLD